MITINTFKKVLFFLANAILTIILISIILYACLLSFSVIEYFFNGFIKGFAGDTEFYKFITSLDYKKVSKDWFYYSFLIYMSLLPFTFISTLLIDYFLLIPLDWFNEKMQYIKRNEEFFASIAMKTIIYGSLILTILLNISRDNLDYLTLIFSAIVALNSFKNNTSKKLGSRISSILQPRIIKDSNNQTTTINTIRRRNRIRTKSRNRRRKARKDL